MASFQHMDLLLKDALQGQEHGEIVVDPASARHDGLAVLAAVLHGDPGPGMSVSLFVLLAE